MSIFAIHLKLNTMARGRKKLSIDDRKVTLGLRLHPSLIKKIHDIALERQVTIVSVVEEAIIKI